MTHALQINANGVQNLPGEDRSILLVASEEKYKELRSRNQRIPLLEYTLYGELATLGLKAFLALEERMGQHRFKSQIEKFRGDWGDLKLLRITPPDAIKFFTFSNPPMDGSVYRLNPFNPRQYLEPASYTEHIAREKVGAFIRVASTLGAKKICLVSASIESSRRWWASKASLPDVAAQIGITAEFTNDKIVKETVYAEYGKPELPPFVPKEIENWVDSVPEIRALAQNRLDGKPIRLGCNLVLEGSTSSEAKIIGGWNSAGLDVGGKHRKLARSVWKFDIEFWQ
jgi:hypothetical protein